MLRFAAVFGALLMVVAAAQPSFSAKAPRPRDIWDKPMKIVIVRSSEKSCEPLCPQWLMAEGRIERDTPALLFDAYRRAANLADGAKLPLVIRSPGGNILSALQMGYFLRSRGIDVAVGTTAYEGCSPFGKSCTPKPEDGGSYRGRVTTDQSFCLSACPLVLASGIRRVAHPSAVIAVHHWGFEEKPGEKKTKTEKKAKKQKGETEDDKLVRRMMSNYLSDMSISQGLIDDMDKAPFTSAYMVKPKRREALRLVTDPRAPSVLTGAALCDADLPAPSCIVAGDTHDYRTALSQTGVTYMDAAMTITLVRASSPACEPVCPEFIAMKGAIKPDTPKRLAKILAQAGKRKLPVLLDSQGGDADAALELGRMIAKRGLDVITGDVSYAGCTAGPCLKAKQGAVYRGTPKPPAEECRGACALIFAAGRNRAAENAFVLYPPDRFYSRAAPQKSAERVADYLVALKQDALLARMKSGTASSPVTLTISEASELTLTTPGASAPFTEHLCDAKPRPGMCVKR